MAGVNDAMLALGNVWGAKAVIDVRSGGSIFNYPDYSSASFYNATQNAGSGTAAVWGDARLHPGDAGHAAMAVQVAAGLRRLALR